MRILLITKYPPIEGGVSSDAFWWAQFLAEAGNEVHVLTNADEVEPEYRIQLNESDIHLLQGYTRPNLISLYSTSWDTRHIFVPQTKPYASKLISLGLNIVEKAKPDVIIANYIEPYGVVALFLSLLTCTPYIIRHAGSDLFRLLNTPQLSALHISVLRRSLAVLTHSSHHEYLIKLGVDASQLLPFVSVKVRGDVFYPEEPRSIDPFIIGSYGKTGPSKGTDVLLEAVRGLIRINQNIQLHARWAGRNRSKYYNAIQMSDVSSNVRVLPLIPHWQVPQFIRSCNLIAFLESSFPIPAHSPAIPMEVLLCGRHVLTTSEIAQKPIYRDLLREPENAFIINGPLTSEAIIKKVEAAISYLTHAPANVSNNLSGYLDTVQRIRMRDLLDKIQCKLQSSLTLRDL